MAPRSQADKEAKGEDEEPAIVRDLKALDDQYLAIDRACAKEVLAIQRKYNLQQEPILGSRAALLAQRQGVDRDDETPDEETGTPALKGFWLKALLNHSELGEEIQEHDFPLLEFVQDIRHEVLFDEPAEECWEEKGFRIVFRFAENVFFSNEELWVEWSTEEDSPYTGDTSVVAVKASAIVWYVGKNVTVETAKKTRKKGKDSKKKGAGKEEARLSFFRSFFRDLKRGDPLPEAALELELESDSDADDNEFVERLLEDSYDVGCMLRDQVIPFAVRWYTGEACAGSDDNEDGEEEDPHSDSADDSDEQDTGSDVEDGNTQPRRGRQREADKKT